MSNLRRDKSIPNSCDFLCDFKKNPLFNFLLKIVFSVTFCCQKEADTLILKTVKQSPYGQMPRSMLAKPRSESAPKVKESQELLRTIKMQGEHRIAIHRLTNPPGRIVLTLEESSISERNREKTLGKE